MKKWVDTFKNVLSHFTQEIKINPIQSIAAIVTLVSVVGLSTVSKKWWLIVFILFILLLLLLLYIKKRNELFQNSQNEIIHKTYQQNWYGIALFFLQMIIIVVLFIPFTGNQIENIFWSTPIVELEISETPYDKSENQVVATNIPIITPLATKTINVYPTTTVSLTSTKEQSDGLLTIAITEIMANPCGWGRSNQNEYIELYNYGDYPINVEGWFISTSQQNGEPDKISTWWSRNYYSLGKDLIEDSTIIEPGQFAVILSPYYHLSDNNPKMPYNFPKKTILLTIEIGDNLGNKTFGIRGAKDAVQDDGVFLFTGTEKLINEVVSTYGVKIVGTSPDFQNNLKKGLPIGTSQCDSVQRIVVSGDDVSGNWEVVSGGNPGSGPY